MKVDKVSVANIGTTAEPIASLVLDASLKVDTVLQHTERRMLYEFRGDQAKATAVEKL